MASVNRKPVSVRTHEGAVAKRITPSQELQRSVFSCLLWENEFYESGQSIADRIASLVPMVAPEEVRDIAIAARINMKLRHVPLLIAKCMCALPEHKKYVREVLSVVVNRPDEMGEFLSLYWMNGKTPIAAQAKKGLADAFCKFDEYQLAKWNNKRKQIKLVDVMKLVHPKPMDNKQAEMWGRLKNDELATPETWEVMKGEAVRKGTSVAEVWRYLINNRKLPEMALLKNLRSMINDGVATDFIREAIVNMRVRWALPFRFITAARMMPMFEPELEQVMLRVLSGMEKMKGETVLLVDVSGSMDRTRLDNAYGLAILLREICEKVRIYTFSGSLIEVPARRGFALADAIENSQQHGGTWLGASVKAVYAPRGSVLQERRSSWYGGRIEGQGLNPERLIVITDEQSHDRVPDPKSKGYMVNVASYRRGVGYGAWNHVDGWSESIVKWIQECETHGFY